MNNRQQVHTCKLIIIMLFSILVCFFLYLSFALCQNQLSIYDGNLEKFLDTIKEHSLQVMKKLENIEDADEIFIKMMDSSTKIPNGLMNGNLFDLGNFDECYNIHSGNIYGKYCLGTLTIPDTMKQSFNTTQKRQIMIHPELEPRTLSGGNIELHWAVCVPSNMAANEIQYLLQNYTEDFCYSKATEPKLSTGAITTIVILSIFLLIIVVSTTFDIYLFYTEKESPHELLIAFSFLTNGRKLFTSSTNPDQLLCLNGIKAISMMWVIIGHEYSNAANAPLSNLLYVLEWQKDAANMFINGATVSVDSFFVVGGLVTVYTYLKSMDKGIKFNILLFYLHRYLRLTPALGIAMLVHLFLLPYFGNGSLWKDMEISLVESCKKTWWQTLLYITNYIKEGNCVPQTWYLSVDMQLFILSPIILIPLFKWPLYGVGALAILILAGVIVPFVVAYTEDMGSMFTDPNYMKDYYIQIYTRFGPYVTGMLLGYFIYKLKASKDQLHLNRITVGLLWICSLAGLIACVYGGYHLISDDDKWGNYLYTALNSPAWGVALAMVIYLCVAGYGGPVNGFLSLPIFQFLTKLSYSMYLVHFAVIIVRYSVMRNVFAFSNIVTMHHFWGDFICTLVISLVFCLSFESPVIILEKYIFGRDSSK